jgi:hypothetical protein
VSDPLNANADTSSAGSFSFFQAEQIPTDEDLGDVVDAVIVDEEPKKPRGRLKTGYTEPASKTGDDRPRTTPPKIDEWMDFISRVLIRASTDFYIDTAFRDIDEEWLTDREVERIKLTDVERDRIARPLAELANKTKFTRKHGRAIIALSGSVDSVIQLGMWFSRVNRIAAKYRALGLANPAQPKRGNQANQSDERRKARFTPPPPPPQETVNDVSFGPGTQSGSESNGRSRFRPNIAGEVAYPDAG